MQSRVLWENKLLAWESTFPDPKAAIFENARYAVKNGWHDNNLCMTLCGTQNAKVFLEFSCILNFFSVF